MLDDENTTIQELVKEQDLVEQYENKFMRTKKKVNEYLNPKGHGQGDVASIRSSPEKRTSCRLPKIALKVHDGTSLEWLGWWSQFEAIHENPSLSEVDKFHYLIQSMKVGTRAERLVKSYPLTEVNYPKVIDALRDRFGDKSMKVGTRAERLVKSYLLTEANYPKVIEALRDRFGDKVILTEVYVRQLLKLVINNNTRLGLVISEELPKGGETSPHLVYNIRVKYEDHLDKLLQRFREIEEIPSRPTELEEDEFCRNLYKREVHSEHQLGDILFPCLLNLGFPVKICLEERDRFPLVSNDNSPWNDGCYGLREQKWDESLDGSIRDLWRKFRDELKYLRTLRIPRWLGTGGNQELQLHDFNDASGDAYAAVVYLRVANKDGIRVVLLAAKTRLAPIHRVSISRLELCAVALLTRLVIHVVSVLKLDIKEIVRWTDATIILS
ncbi:hypothetical protein LAZ67_2006805 [Cordylochernes scorpioides]|uniref:Uncharacterized protein n=1 Tax=Cordylochernes scorpioides TaxID=51811 RepID=A0ABY6K781_9ARAC|nr:hypothetical protein LAZ67_2006805 [Cordylochernes scorpioides]